MSSEPLILTTTALALLHDLQAVAPDVVRLPPSTSAWTPFRVVLRAHDAVLARAGEAALGAACRGMMRVARPFPEIFQHQALKVLRHHPREVFRLLPVARAAVTKGLGRVQVDDCAKGCRIAYRDLPLDVVQSRGWRIATAAAFAGALDHMSLDGGVDVDAGSADAITFVVRWSLPMSEQSQASAAAR